MIRVATFVESFVMIRPEKYGASIMQPFGKHNPQFSQKSSWLSYLKTLERFALLPSCQVSRITLINRFTRPKER